jgi:hypothetical protein
MHMLKERLQILVSTEQRRRLEQEARRRRTSIGNVIRDAVDAQLGVVTAEDRRAALDEILAMRGRFASPDELNRLAASEHDDQLDELVRAVER